MSPSSGSRGQGGIWGSQERAAHGAEGFERVPKDDQDRSCLFFNSLALVFFLNLFLCGQLQSGLRTSQGA